MYEEILTVLGQLDVYLDELDISISETDDNLLEKLRIGLVSWMTMKNIIISPNSLVPQYGRITIALTKTCDIS